MAYSSDVGKFAAIFAAELFASCSPLGNNPFERVEEAMKKKDHGTKEFMLGHYLVAAKSYKSAAGLVTGSCQEHTKDMHINNEVEYDIYIKCWGNAALCYVKEKLWNDVIFCCNKILDTYPKELETNVKLVYHRGLANMNMHNWKHAKADLNAALAIDGTNKHVRATMTRLRVKIAEFNSKERSQFGGMFTKVCMYDEKSFNLVNVPINNGDELTNFPDTVLATVAQYLTKTERALVAVAMTASSSAWSESKWQKRPHIASQIMIAAKPLSTESTKYNYRLQRSYDWDFFDFRDINESLARKLSDEDVGGILICIDAVRTIKVLKLTGLFNIVGHGLEPLRGTRLLEHLDLNPGLLAPLKLVLPTDILAGMKHYSSLSEDVVVPILDSIITVEGSSLTQLNLPKKWRVNKVPLLTQFLTRYNRALNRRELPCSQNGCTSTCRHVSDSPWVPRIARHDGMYGVQQHICHECNDHFCAEHSEEMMPFICEICELTCCVDCNPTKMCEMCNVAACQECVDTSTCEICDVTSCEKCCPTYYCDYCDEIRCLDCSPHLFCVKKGCYKSNCGECMAEEDSDFVIDCPECNVCMCGEHLVLDLHSHGSDGYCEACRERARSVLKQANRAILERLHEWESACGYQDRFEIDLESNDFAKLYAEHTRMKQRWDQLSTIITTEQRKKTRCPQYLFIQEVHTVAV
jgi:hypothetical protein